jgi:hypothetical protein
MDIKELVMGAAAQGKLTLFVVPRHLMVIFTGTPV